MTTSEAPSTADPAVVPPRADRERTLGLVALTVVQVCFGLFPVAAKLAFAGDGFSPGAVAAWRVVAGAVVLGALAAAVHGRAFLPPARLLPRLFCCGLTGVVLNQGLFLEGLARTQALHAGLLMSLIPVFTYVIALGVRQETLEPRRVAGIVVALAGTVPLFLAAGTTLGSGLTGDLLVAANAFSYSVYLVISKPLTRDLPALVIIAWVYLFSLPAVPVFLAGEPLAPAGPGHAEAWFALVYIVVFATILAYLLNVFALARVRASTTAFFVFLQPLISGAGGVLLLGETFRPAIGVAALGLLAGMWLVVRRKR